MEKKQTQIPATMGPTLQTVEELKRMINSGVYDTGFIWDYVPGIFVNIIETF